MWIYLINWYLRAITLDWIYKSKSKVLVLKSGLAYVHVSAASLCTNVNMELHARDFLIVFSFYRFLLHVLGKKSYRAFWHATSLHFYARVPNFQLTIFLTESSILADLPGGSLWAESVSLTQNQTKHFSDRSPGFFSLSCFFSTHCTFLFLLHMENKRNMLLDFFLGSALSRVCWVHNMYFDNEAVYMAAPFWRELPGEEISYPDKSLSTAAMSIPMQEYIYVP